MALQIIIPLLHLIVFFCLAMSVMLFVKKVYMAIVIIVVKLFRKRPEWRYIWEPMHEKDEVLVQIPMYNKKEVYQLSIGAACGLSWTSDRIIIQVLDDSTDPVIKARVQVMEDEKENERNQEEEREGGSKAEATKHEKIKGKRKVMEDEKENERNQEEEREGGTKVEAMKHEKIRDRKQVKTTEEKGKRKRRGGDMVEERKSQAKRRKEGPALAEVIDEKKPGRQRKKKRECRGVWSCMAIGCGAIAGFTTSALILVALANIRYVEDETVYLFPT